MVFRSPKGTSLRRTASCDEFCAKIGADVLSVHEVDLKNPKIAELTLASMCAKSPMRRNETPYLIWMKFCRMVDIPNAVTHANVGDDR